MKKLLVLWVAAAVALGPAALAAGDPPAADKQTAEKAAPADKKVDYEKGFQRRDANGDKALSLEEFLAGKDQAQTAQLEGRFKKLDQDGDGTLSLQEFSDRSPLKKSGGKAAKAAKPKGESKTAKAEKGEPEKADGR